MWRDEWSVWITFGLKIIIICTIINLIVTLAIK